MKLEEIRRRASEKAESLKMPESIRTPGRTWTRYPDLDDFEDSGDVEIKSEGEVEVFTGEEALENSEREHFDAIKVEENKLNALHASALGSAVLVKVTGDSEVKILYKGGETHCHVLVEAEESAELEISEYFRNSGNLTSTTEIYVGENATVDYGAIESSESDFTYCRRKAVVDDHGTVNWLNTQFEGELKRTKIETVLKGDGSETEKLAVWYPTGEQHNDISMHAYHRGENTRCQMDSRAVVDDEARSVYEGMQHVGDRADDTQSFQDENVLMLSQDCEVDASPKLMIEDPNVEASHAASAGNLPEKELHYMQSRGLSEGRARRLIVKGYFEPVLEQMELSELKQKVREEIGRKLSR